MFERAGTVFAGTPDWAAQSEEQEKQILICQFSSHVGRWFPATSRQTEKTSPSMLFLHC